jgi:hypothetical protein
MHLEVLMMLSTIFMFFMSVWMLALALQYGVASFSVIALLTAMMVSVRMLQHGLFSRKHIPAHSTSKINR